MAKRAGAYRSEKRKKEVKRQKKQEEKRLRRLGLLKPAEGPEAVEGAEGGEAEAGLPPEGEASEDEQSPTGDRQKEESACD